MFKEIIKKLIPHHKSEQQSNEWGADKIAKITPISNKVLKIIADCDFPYSDKDNWEEVSKAIRQPVKDILELYLENNLLLSDLKLVQMMIVTKIDRIQQTINDSLNNSSEKIEESLFGCPKRELDFKTLDAVLREVEEIWTTKE